MTGESGSSGSAPAIDIWPGNPAYTTDVVRDEVARADIVVGFETVVRYIDSFVGGDTLTCGYDDESTTLQRFDEWHLLVLPRPYDWMPDSMAEFLLDSASPGERTRRSELRATVYEHLTHEDERSAETTLEELAARSSGDGSEDSACSNLSVLLVWSDDS